MEQGFFDLVGLSFDPPENNARLVKRKIEQKLTDLASALVRETQQIKRDELQAQIDYLNGIATLILSPDGKNLVNSEFVLLANKKIEQTVELLTISVKTLSLTGNHTVSMSTIRLFRRESRLSLERIKKVFIDNNFEIDENDMLSAFPKFPTNADRIYSELAALRKTKDPNPNGIDTSIATDLYSFAAYISNDSENISLYRAMDTKELWGIFDPASRRYSQRNDDLGKLCGSLALSAKTYVFNSDENRAAYDTYMLYKNDKAIQSMMLALDVTPVHVLLETDFAEKCIEQIMKIFSKYEVALAIYNKAIAYKDVVYVPKTKKLSVETITLGI